LRFRKKTQKNQDHYLLAPNTNVPSHVISLMSLFFACPITPVLLTPV